MASSEHATLLVLHGGLLLFVGMAVGVPYALAAIADAGSEAAANWRVAHVQNLQNGMLLLLVAACSSYLALSTSAFQAMTWILVVAAYCDMVGWFVRAMTGHRGLEPKPPAANLLVCALFGLTALGQFVGILVFIFGAWRALG